MNRHCWMPAAELDSSGSKGAQSGDVGLCTVPTPAQSVHDLVACRVFLLDLRLRTKMQP